MRLQVSFWFWDIWSPEDTIRAMIANKQLGETRSRGVTLRAQSQTSLVMIDLQWMNILPGSMLLFSSNKTCNMSNCSEYTCGLVLSGWEIRVRYPSRPFIMHFQWGRITYTWDHSLSYRWYVILECICLIVNHPRVQPPSVSGCWPWRRGCRFALNNTSFTISRVYVHKTP